jgi:hypothetical protein
LRQRGYDARALVGGITAWHAIGGATVPLDASNKDAIAESLKLVVAAAIASQITF